MLEPEMVICWAVESDDNAMRKVLWFGLLSTVSCKGTIVVSTWLQRRIPSCSRTRVCYGLLCRSRETNPAGAAKGLRDWSLTISSASQLSPSKSLWSKQQQRKHHAAQVAYAEAGLLGSPDKDKCAVEEGQVIGAFLNSSQRARSRGLCTVGAPVDKRLSLACLSLQLAQLPFSTYGLHSCIMGAWVSMMVYRRPMMSIFDAAFKLVSNEEAASLPRAVAQELALVAVLSPLMQTNLGAPFDEFLYATDASEHKGAICRTRRDKELQEVLFRCCRTKGAYTSFFHRFKLYLQRSMSLRRYPKKALSFLQKSLDALLLVFEFLEIYSGASGVTKFVSSFGVICGPPIDISLSEEYDMKMLHLVSWVTHLIARGALKAVLLMPPGTTFSVMRRPALRDKVCPFGYNPNELQTRDGNILAQRSFQVAETGAVNGAIAKV